MRKFHALKRNISRDFLMLFSSLHFASFAFCGNLSTRKKKLITGETRTDFAKINFRILFGPLPALDQYRNCYRRSRTRTEYLAALTT